MPEGQYTGNRAAYIYTSDSGTNIVLQLDTTLADLPGTGLVKATNASLGDAIPKPQKFYPRGVHWQGILNGDVKRKFITCNTGSDYVESDVSQSLTIDGVAGFTTGRRGEKITFVRADEDGAAV